SCVFAARSCVAFARRWPPGSPVAPNYSIPSVCMSRRALPAFGKRCVLEPCRTQAAEGRCDESLAAVDLRWARPSAAEHDSVLGECRIRREAFVEEVRGGRRRSPGDKGVMA